MDIFINTTQSKYKIYLDCVALKNLNEFISSKKQYKNIIVITDSNVDHFIGNSFNLKNYKLYKYVICISVQNQMTAKNPDNYMLLMHKIMFITNSGNLTLSGTNGPIIWESCLDKPHDKNGKFNLEESNEFSKLKTFEIAEDNEETYSSMMKLSWVNSISKSIIEFINCIDSKKANIVEQQYLISAIETWGELSRELGQSKIIQPYKKNAIKINDLKGGKNE